MSHCWHQNVIVEGIRLKWEIQQRIFGDFCLCPCHFVCGDSSRMGKLKEKPVKSCKSVDAFIDSSFELVIILLPRIFRIMLTEKIYTQ